MAFEVQNDAGTVEGANSYADVAYFRSYHSSRGRPEGDYDDGAVQVAMVLATDYIDSRFQIKGLPLTTDQTTAFPRQVGGIPIPVKEACAEYAYFSLVNGELYASPGFDESGRLIKSKSEKIGPITETTVYADSPNFVLPQYPVADNKLIVAGLVKSGCTTFIRRG